MGQCNSGAFGLGNNDNNKCIYPPKKISNNDFHYFETKNIKDIYCGKKSTFFVLDNNKVYGCGFLTNNEVADNDLYNRPVEIMPYFLGTKHKFRSNVIQIVESINKTYFLMDNGDIYCTNKDSKYFELINSYDEIYNNTLLPNENSKIININCTRHAIILLTENNNIYINGKITHLTRDILNYYEFTLLKIDEKIRQISAGDDHILILTDDGQLYGLGSNANNRLGIYEKQIRYVDSVTKIASDKINNIYCSRNISCILLYNGSICIFGSGKKSYTIKTDSKIKQMSNTRISTVKWIPNIHEYLSEEYKDRIKTLLLAIKKSKIKIDKNVFFNIIKDDYENFKYDYENFKYDYQKGGDNIKKNISKNIVSELLSDPEINK